MQQAKESIRIRLMQQEDIPAVLDLQHSAFPDMLGWSAEQLTHHLEVFPKGQLVAIDEAINEESRDERNKIVGSASSLIIDWDDYSEAAQWSTITANGTFDTHNPLGKTLYGADMSVDPLVRKRGIGSRFYEERKILVRELKLKRLLTGGRIPGYDAVARGMSPRQYVAEVVTGKRKDPILNFQLKNQFVVLDVIPEYLHDAASHGFATLLEWLNPEYAIAMSLEVVYQPSVQEAIPDKVIPVGRVRIAAIQYLFRGIHGFDDFAKQVEFFVRGAEEYRCQFIVFPEYFTMQLLSYLREPAAGRAVRRLAQLTSAYEELFRGLAIKSRLYIIAGTHPVIEKGELFNAAHLFTPNGRIYRQKKVHLTTIEKGPYQMSRGHGFYVYHTEYGRIAILVCYDVEFPEAARLVAEGGARIIFVPSCTDDRQGFCRVRYCSQARAIENQLYVAMASTVGKLQEVPYMATHYGQAAIFTPSDYHFARDGIAAEGNMNQEQMIISDVDLHLLDEQRVSGTVIPINDMIKDAYDRVIHCA